MVAAAAKGVFFNVHISNRAYSVHLFSQPGDGDVDVKPNPSIVSVSVLLDVFLYRVACETTIAFVDARIGNTAGNEA